jgi:hypothetical protein
MEGENGEGREEMKEEEEENKGKYNILVKKVR